MVQEQNRLPLKDQEQMELISACKNALEKYVVVGLLDTGLRVTEFLNMKREDIDWQTGTINIKSLKIGKSRKAKEKRGRRSVPISPSFRPLLEIQYKKLIAMKDDSSSLKMKLLKMTRSGVLKMLKKIARRTTISAMVSPHILRDSFAVNCIRKGVDVRSLRDMMGHHSVAVTDKYLKFVPGAAVEDAKRKLGW